MTTPSSPAPTIAADSWPNSWPWAWGPSAWRCRRSRPWRHSSIPGGRRARRAIGSAWPRRPRCPSAGRRNAAPSLPTARTPGTAIRPRPLEQSSSAKSATTSSSPCKRSARTTAAAFPTIPRRRISTALRTARCSICKAAGSIEKSISPRDLDALEVEIRDGTEVWVKFEKFQDGTAQKIVKT